jgi:hypothetical protein
MRIRRIVGLGFLFLGMIIFLIKPLGNITGFVIDYSYSVEEIFYLFSIISMIFGTGLIYISRNDLEVIDGIKYEHHALDRMEHKWGISIYPRVVRGVIESGKEYRLKHVKDPEATSGATRVYIGREVVAKRSPSDSRHNNRAWLNMLVLTDEKGVVKTVEVSDERNLKNFIKHYVSLN